MNEFESPGADVNFGPKRIAALLTSFNRRSFTLQSIESLFAQKPVDAELKVFLVDDASTDGTAQVVAERFPQVHLVNGTGDLYWGRGMHRAFSLAMEEQFDYYLWVNDDTVLLGGALRLLVETAEAMHSIGPPAIVTGSTVDATTGALTYGGIGWRSRWMPPLFRHVSPDAKSPVVCATMNGNFTLIPAAVTDVVGNVDPRYQHTLADMDYGLRATKAGFAVYAAPGYIGACSDNSTKDTWRDPRLSLRRRWKLMQSPKGAPWREWSYFARRHMGPLWPVYAALPYLRLVLSAATVSLSVTHDQVQIPITLVQSRKDPSACRRRMVLREQRKKVARD